MSDLSYKTSAVAPPTHIAYVQLSNIPDARALPYYCFRHYQNLNEALGKNMLLCWRTPRLQFLLVAEAELEASTGQGPGGFGPQMAA